MKNYVVGASISKLKVFLKTHAGYVLLKYQREICVMLFLKPKKNV